MTDGSEERARGGVWEANGTDDGAGTAIKGAEKDRSLKTAATGRGRRESQGERKRERQAKERAKKDGRKRARHAVPLRDGEGLVAREKRYGFGGGSSERRPLAWS
jgi:hypothetical protein